MKKVLFLAVIGMSLMMASCGFKSQTRKIVGDLTSYTALNENGDTLTGVRNGENQDVVPPKAGVWFTTDKAYKSILMEIDKKTEARRYYTLDGKPLADTPLTGLKSIIGANGSTDELVYVAQGPDKKVYGFFSNTGEVFKCSEYTVNEKASVIAFAQDDGFAIYTLGGELSWKVTESSFFFVNQTFPTLPKIVVPGKKTATVFDLKGQEISQIPISKWNGLIKKIDTKVVGPATVITLADDL